MDNSSGKHDWNVHAQTFEPKQTDESEPEENYKQIESDDGSSSAGASQPMTSHDNGYMSYFLTNSQPNDLIAQLSNMSLANQQYMYLQSLSNPSFQNSMVSNRFPSTPKSLAERTHPSNLYQNAFIYNRINQPPMLPMPYLIPQNVPNMTNAAGRSRRNSCMVNKVFNTGDIEIDKNLTECYKKINPRSDFIRDMGPSRFFVIKSYTEDHVHRSIKYGEWCSTQRGNDILDKAYRSVHAQGGHVYLFFSVNSSGYFCGVAEMMSECDSGRRSSHWNDDKWQGGFLVNWLYVKDVPNKYLKHIILEHNDNRPITNSRDATEIKPAQKGNETLRLMHEYHHNSSLFDDFDFYESREKESFANVAGQVLQ